MIYDIRLLVLDQYLSFVSLNCMYNCMYMDQDPMFHFVNYGSLVQFLKYGSLVQFLKHLSTTEDDNVRYVFTLDKYIVKQVIFSSSFFFPFFT